MATKPFLTTARAAKIAVEAISFRRQICADESFVKMGEVWNDLCDGGDWEIKNYRAEEDDRSRRMAGAVSFDGRVTLIVNESLMSDASRGCSFSNFVLAHELGHLLLNHHANSASMMNFRLFTGPSGFSNRPPSVEERETNFAAVFIQCGVALLNSQWDSRELARRAFCDFNSVKNVQAIARLEVFRREYDALSRPRERVIL